MFKPNTTVALVVKCQEKLLLVEEFEDVKTIHTWTPQITKSIRASVLGSLVMGNQDEKVHLGFSGDTTYVMRFGTNCASLISITNEKKKHTKEYFTCFPTYVTNILGDLSGGESPVKFGIGKNSHYLKAVTDDTIFITQIILEDFNHNDLSFDNFVMPDIA